MSTPPRWCFAFFSIVSIVSLGALGCASDPAPPTCPAIEGTTPFGVRLEGASTGDDGSRVTATIDVYFPKGRVVGGPVVFSTPWGIARGVLDGSLSATMQSGTATCGSGISGTLLGPSDGIEATVTHARDERSDYLETYSGKVKLCPSGAVPPSSAKASPTVTIDPDGSVLIATERPVDEASLATIQAKTAAGSLTLTTTMLRGGFRLRTASGFPVAAATTIDLSGVRDVLGGPLGLGSTQTAVPSATASDLSFAKPPSKEALLGGPFENTAGRLRLGTRDWGWSAVLAIGKVDGATKLRMRHRADCASSGYPMAEVKILSADGASVTVNPACTSDPYEGIALLPGAGPWVLHATATRNYIPCTTAAQPLQMPIYEIDQIDFE